MVTVKRRRKVCYSRARVMLMNRFRLLWEQHVYWTRMAILSIVFGLPDSNATVERLLRNVPDFKATLRRFYSEAQVDKFGSLLREHLTIAGDLVKAAKAGDDREAARLEKKWYANADEIVEFLNKMNPYWSVREMRRMWHRHLALTKDEAVYMISGQYKKSIATFDTIEKLALEMADSFSRGIIRQFKI